MKTCATLGQAAGTAAAYCALSDVKPSTLANDAKAVWSIQQQLLRDDQYIIGVYNEDPRDVARKAEVTASSEWIEGKYNGSAAQILSGQTRAVFGKGGVHDSQQIDGINRWVSKKVPAWIALDWSESIKDISLVELVFDTGMHRTLMLSQIARNLQKMVWGRPQPETVKNYDIQVRLDGSDTWQNVATIEGNYLRKRVHNVADAVRKVDKAGKGVAPLRVYVRATNGVEQARICEVRVYGNDGLEKFPQPPEGLNINAERLVLLSGHARAL
ncbi:unnamed protein product [Vitrella brassicaformis CCMP3155]|uniref:F5/8 type C domain-containing protein n=1 Tax=Vitrella brassicaformis (strain CCMP3155) TaxID=1169540 RepID=A0A0G4H1X2_VITBC|nr:unnamed protein product [Vitrella brassicaformis CCMP3155]|eukprot:CEM37504.1 unnamed protein product [Vitrella brassicaformis CCMP3155]